MKIELDEYKVAKQKVIEELKEDLRRRSSDPLVLRSLLGELLRETKFLLEELRETKGWSEREFPEDDVVEMVEIVLNEPPKEIVENDG